MSKDKKKETEEKQEHIKRYNKMTGVSDCTQVCCKICSGQSYDLWHCNYRMDDIY